MADLHDHKAEDSEEEDATEIRDSCESSGSAPPPRPLRDGGGASGGARSLRAPRRGGASARRCAASSRARESVLCVCGQDPSV